MDDRERAILAITTALPPGWTWDGLTRKNDGWVAAARPPQGPPLGVESWDPDPVRALWGLATQLAQQSGSPNRA